MNKEEILGAFSLVNNPIVLSEEEVEDVQKAIKQLEQENQKYKEVIDKAIEFLYKIKFDKTDKYICISEYIEYQQLLDILKESE